MLCEPGLVVSSLSITYLFSKYSLIWSSQQPDGTDSIIKLITVLWNQHRKVK